MYILSQCRKRTYYFLFFISTSDTFEPVNVGLLSSLEDLVWIHRNAAVLLLYFLFSSFFSSWTFKKVLLPCLRKLLYDLAKILAFSFIFCMNMPKCCGAGVQEPAGASFICWRQGYNNEPAPANLIFGEHFYAWNWVCTSIKQTTRTSNEISC